MFSDQLVISEQFILDDFLFVVLRHWCTLLFFFFCTLLFFVFFFALSFFFFFFFCTLLGLELITCPYNPNSKNNLVSLRKSEYFFDIIFCSRCFALFLSFVQFYHFWLKLKWQSEALRIIGARKIDSSVISVWLVFMIIGGSRYIYINHQFTWTLFIESIWIHMNSL